METFAQDFIERELQRLDLLLHREILRLRANYQLSLDEFRGLYVSDDQVDALIAQAGHLDGSTPDTTELTERAAVLHETNLISHGEAPKWVRLATEFDLSPFEQDVLLLALAPEIDLKYETLYGYLNNDVSRKYPTIDLALRVFCEDRNREGRGALSPQGRLFAHGLLEPVNNDGSVGRSGLALGFAAAPLVVNYLIGLPVEDRCLLGLATMRSTTAGGFMDLPCSAKIVDQLVRLAELYRSGDDPHLFIFEGSRGSGRSEAVEAFCGALGLQLLRVDLNRLVDDAADLPAQMGRIILQARLRNAGIHLQHCEVVLTGDSSLHRRFGIALERLAEARVPVMLSVDPNTPWREILYRLRVVPIRFPEPNAVERGRLWKRHLQAAALEAADGVVPDLAERFRLNAGQIRNAVAAAGLMNKLKHDNQQTVESGVLFQAARNQSIGHIGKLAQRVPLRYGWGDLVLPHATLQRVRDVVAAIRHRHRVYNDWAMERRFSNANGLMVLFSGPSGTGKTMTAGVIAREIGLDLYRIDLSAVVSKYIGETEKNLDQIFAAARRANAILFFDEADALFGKRSEVKDAHDRYANIEVAYLLQKMEVHDGIVVLATNFSKNMDQAFSRRMHYVVEFPKPDVQHREQLWRGIFPQETPLTDDVDFGFLSRQFDITGGDIRNVALDAAFLAAENGQAIGMEELVKAMARQMTKQGKVPGASDFKQYLAFVEQRY